MHLLVRQKGQSLLEILFAIALFTIGVVTLGYLIFDAYVSTRAGLESLQARLLAEEGIEAVRSISDMSFSGVVAGEYGLEIQDGVWVLTQASSSVGKFTRTMSITDVDAEVKKVSSQILWDITDVRKGNISLTSYITDWDTKRGAAGNVSIDATTAFLTASGTTLSGITLFNLGEADITLTDMKLQWDGDSLLTTISFEGQEIFVAEPLSEVASGTSVDVTDVIIPAYGQVLTLGPVVFSESIADTNMLITLVFSDSTKRYIHIEQ